MIESCLSKFSNSSFEMEWLILELEFTGIYKLMFHFVTKHIELPIVVVLSDNLSCGFVQAQGPNRNGLVTV